MLKRIEKVEVADNFFTTTLGLIGRKTFGASNALLLKNANAIHTFGVFFPIDAVFLDKNYKVLKIIENLKPLRFSPWVFKARHVLEMPAGRAQKEGLQVDDQIEIV